MTDGGRRNDWLRMTDSMGLTELGKKPERPGPRLLLLQIVLWLASALVWFRMVIRTQGEIQVWYAVLVLISLALMVANVVMLRQSKKRAATESKMD